MSDNLPATREANAPSTVSAETMEKVLVGGDLSKLNAQERLQFYNGLCESVGFNPLFKPFDYLLLQNRLTLYLNKGGGEQLRQIRKVSLKISSREKIGDVYVVTAQASTPDGRSDESTGAVDIKGKSGENLANAYMKAETKAKRRVSISICGLNMLDESELDTIAGAKRVSHEDVESGKVEELKEAKPASPPPAARNEQRTNEAPRTSPPPSHDQGPSPGGQQAPPRRKYGDYVVKLEHQAWNGKPLRSFRPGDIKAMYDWINERIKAGSASNAQREFMKYAGQYLAFEVPKAPPPPASEPPPPQGFDPNEQMPDFGNESWDVPQDSEETQP